MPEKTPEQEKPRKKVLLLGDSHAHCVSVMKVDADIVLCKRQSATAYGVNKPDSETNSNSFFLNFLQDRPTPDVFTPSRVYHAALSDKPADFICFMLGEVDCRSMAHKKGLENWTETLTHSANNLVKFIQTNLKGFPPERIALLHPHLSKSAEMRNGWWPGMNKFEALKKITQFTLFYSSKLDELATESNYISFGINNEILDPETGVALPELLANEKDKWHLDRPNKNGENLLEKLWAEKFQKYIL